MAGSTSNLDLISVSQAQKETTANALFDAGSPATLFGRRASTCAALTWGYYGGTLLVGGTPTAISNGTVALSASTTNYVEADASGVVSKNTTGFTDGRIPLYQIVTGASTVSSYTDKRAFLLTPSPIDLSGFYPGVLVNAAVVLRIPVARKLVFGINMAGSYGKASAAATAQTDFDIQVNGVSKATMRFAAAASSATFINAAAFATAAGDVLSVHGPATADATLADVGFVLTGSR